MKIRNGFVSNSSSSSFILLGEKVNINSITPKNLKEKGIEYYVETGLCGGEGTSMAQVKDDKMLEVIKKAYNNSDLTYTEKQDSMIAYKAYKASANDFVELSITEKDNIPKKFKVFGFTIDQYLIDDARELEAMYKGEY